MRKNVSVSAGMKKMIPILWIGDEAEIIYTIRLAGEGAEITMPILLLGKDNQAVSILIDIDHQKPNTKSRLLVKGALTDKSRVDFNGLVKIEKGARGANAWLGANLLLLSKQASGRAVPNLEIAESDVKAGHAATVGRVSDLELFYLMSRGVSKEAATNLIVEGFLQSLLAEFPEKLADKARKSLRV